jgi:hypothetical protein
VNIVSDSFTTASWQVFRWRERLPPRWVVWITKPVLDVLNCFPCVHAPLVSPVKVRLKPAASLKLDVWYDKIQLKPAFIAMLNPKAVVLALVHTREKALFKAVHQLPFFFWR